MIRAPRYLPVRSIVIGLATVSFIALVGLASAAQAADLFVAPNGQSAAPGTRALPLDLATALSTRSPARPGDTIWLLGGRYVGTFTSHLRGTASAPIVVRQWPGERATLDGIGSKRDVLTVYGEWAIYWGFEVTNTHPGRLSNETGPWPYDLPRGGGIATWGPNIKLVNLVIHDLSGGIGLWKEAVNTEVYGSLVYHNGWEAPDGSHGHGIYTQNATGVRLIRDNITFNQFSHGIHAYGSSAAFLNDIVFEGNVAFNNGILGRSGFERDLLLGGGVLAQRPVVRQNFTYGGAQSNVGYAAGCSNGQISDNVLMGSSPLILVRCAPQMTGNVLYSLYAARYGWSGLNTSFPQNTFFSQRPTTNLVRVRPNLYERGRGHLMIYNWQRLSYVEVDISGVGLQSGESFEVRDAQNFYGAPVLQGVFTGATIAVPMSGLQLDPPIGNVPVVPAHTGPEFGVFVIVATSPTTGGGSTDPVALPTVAPAGGTFSSAVSVSMWTSTAGAQVRYTLDGTEPTATSPLYAGPVSVSTTTVVKARAFAAGRAPSGVATQHYVITQVAPAPSITPNGGSFSSSVAVTLSTALSGSAIRYTTDGSVPGATSPLYQGPFTVSTTTTVRARTYAAGSTESAVTTAVFTNASDRPPTVDWLHPAESAVVSATTSLSASASDDRGVARVEFSVNGSVVGTAQTAPYQVSWNTLAVANATYQLVATAVDSAGQRTATAVRNVRVVNGVGGGGSASTVRLEAEAGTLVAPMIAAGTPSASGGRYVGNSYDNQGSVSLTFTVSTAGAYRVWLRTMAMNGETLFVSVDGAGEQLFSVPRERWRFAWQWTALTSPGVTTPVAVWLEPGVHTIRVRTGRAVTRLDALIVTSDTTLVP